MRCRVLRIGSEAIDDNQANNGAAKKDDLPKQNAVGNEVKMTRYAILAEELYILSLNIDKYNKRHLNPKKQAAMLTCTLSAMQFLLSCLKTETIREDNAHIIINTLENILCTRYFDFASNLLNAEEKTEPCVQQELLFDLSCIISLCIGSLCNKEKNYRETVRRYIASIQTAARTFLSPEHSAYLQAEDATKAIRVYLKCD